ncbi:hypothetical protein M9H77_13699 [Catharanthus roseus]|uniref:Uncharacterized protein n=1 Tax=Catharanthus roseus TaxID=4058 RepID=A0ACC0BL34_CATRO|nr:hypothetical protein M9H77_13699 [Catharanthus roseus]
MVILDLKHNLNFAKSNQFGISSFHRWRLSVSTVNQHLTKEMNLVMMETKKTEANNPRPETRTGCPAMIVIKLVDSQRWRVVEVELQHNHHVSPEVKRFYKSHKKMILAAKQAQQSKPVTEIHTIKLYRTSTVDGNELKSMERKRRHALNVLNYNGVEEIPSQYILPRWYRNYKCRFSVDHRLKDVYMNDHVKRYNHLCKHAIQIVEEGFESPERYRALMQHLEELMSKFTLADDT